MSFLANEMGQIEEVLEVMNEKGQNGEALAVGAKGWVQSFSLRGIYKNPKRVAVSF